MREESLREFFAYVRNVLHVNLGAFCDRNCIYRSDFSNFMKGKKFYTNLYELEIMQNDILDHCKLFLDLYK